MRSGSLSLQIASPKVLQFRFTNKIKIWLCFKCKVDIGTVMNVFWNCDKIKMYWKEIKQNYSKDYWKDICIVPEGIPSCVYSVQQVCVLTLIKNVYWIFVYTWPKNVYYYYSQLLRYFQSICGWVRRLLFYHWKN